MRALVVGYGSPIRGDDAIGPLAADRIEEIGVPDGVEVQARHILSAELVEDLSRVDLVVFLDAAADVPPGSVHHRRLAPDATAPSTMAHFHDPRELLAWCQVLHGRAPDAWLVTAGGGEWGYSDYRLSPAAEAALGPMIERAMELLGLGESTRRNPPPTGHEAPVS